MHLPSMGVSSLILDGHGAEHNNEKLNFDLPCVGEGMMVIGCKISILNIFIHLIILIELFYICLN